MNLAFWLIYFSFVYLKFGLISGLYWTVIGQVTTKAAVSFTVYIQDSERYC